MRKRKEINKRINLKNIEFFYSHPFALIPSITQKKFDLYFFNKNLYMPCF